uniref:Transient receptor potential ion channel melastatin 1 n=1 Tax=Hofstenia miamia TaxID=442651 RepID=A0A7G7LK87_HOFMI|nr:transient receptor potential ion channel melastatin 1 [Hofstenia miamia]
MRRNRRSNNIKPTAYNNNVETQRSKENIFREISNFEITKEKFYRKECNVFVKLSFDKCCKNKSKSEEEHNSTCSKCYCGRLKSEHKYCGEDDSKVSEWSSDKCTLQLPTNAHGKMEFKNADSLYKFAYYLRCSNETDCSKLVSHMTEDRYWKLNQPSMVISLTGGAQELKMSKKEKEALKTGLKKIAVIKDAWIVDGGTNSGIMKICGDAMKDFVVSKGSREKSVVLIGVATWGAIRARSTLINPENSVRPVSYDSSMEMTGAPIDPNHTHFIFVDDGTQHAFGREQELRAGIEAEICKRGLKDNSTIKVPIVCVIVEGGPGTIDTARNALMNKTPCVTVNGSGRAANVIADAYKLGKKMDELTENDREVIRKSLDEHNVKGEKNLDWIIECLEHRDLINVFELSEGNTVLDIDRAILEALLKCGSATVSNHVNLALRWNRSDIATLVLKKESLRKENLYEFMEDVIVEDKYEFTQLFLEQENFKMEEFLTPERLLNVYKKSITTYHSCYLRHKLDKLNFTRKAWKIENTTLDIIYKKVLSKSINIKILPLYKDDDNKVFSCPERELFIFSILFIREKHSFFFWEECPHKVASALIACILFNKICNSTMLREDIILQKKINRMSSKFQTAAQQIIDWCYTNDDLMTLKLLVAPQKVWDNKTCIDLAVTADCKEFVALAGCQFLLQKVWKGRMVAHTSYSSIFRAIICPLFIYKIWFENDNIKSESQKKTLPPDQREMIHQKSDVSVITADDSRFLNFDRPQKPFKIWHRIYYFYTAPVTAFFLNYIMYIIFVVAFSIVNIIGFKNSELPSWIEWIISFWILTLFLEECRQFIMASNDFSIFHKLSAFLNIWNVMDCFAAIVCYVPGFVLRLVGQSDLAHGFYIGALLCYYLRLTRIFALHEDLGPKLVMISRMMRDLRYFIFILLVIVIAYGVAVEALIYPGDTNLWSIIWGVIFRPFFQMFGELMLQDIGAEGPCTDPAYPYKTCPEANNKERYALILQMLYMMFTNILLLNLLIAMFNSTFEKVEQYSAIHWKFQLYSVIREFYERPVLPQPLIILSHLWLFLKYIKDCVKHNRFQLTPNILRHRTLDKVASDQMNKWEDLHALECQRNIERENRKTVENRIKDIDERTATIRDNINDFNQSKMLRKLEGTVDAASLSDVVLNFDNKKLSQMSEKINSLRSEMDGFRKDVSEIKNNTNKLESMLEMVLQSMTYQPPKPISPSNAFR